MNKDSTKAQNSKSTDSFGRSNLKLVIGLVFIVLGIVALINWFDALWLVIKGCIGLLLVMAGVITIAISKE